MHPLIAPVIATLLSVYKERIKTKSTIDGAVLTTAASLVASGITEPVTALPPGSVESYVVAIVTGVIGLYRILKKDVVR